MQENRILLTNFRGKNNSSAVVVERLRVKNADKLELTNSFKTSLEELRKAFSAHNYDYVVSFGRKPDADSDGNGVCDIEIELYARRHWRKLKTNFPYRKLQKYLADRGIEVRISENAGKFLCNNIYYEGLKYLKHHAPRTKMLFIHTPDLDEDFNFKNFIAALSDFLGQL